MAAWQTGGRHTNNLAVETTPTNHDIGEGNLHTCFDPYRNTCTEFSYLRIINLSREQHMTEIATAQGLYQPVPASEVLYS